MARLEPASKELHMRLQGSTRILGIPHSDTVDGTVRVFAAVSAVRNGTHYPLERATSASWRYELLTKRGVLNRSCIRS